VDEGVLTRWYVDGDGDGYGSTDFTEACAAPGAHVAEATDCDDADATAFPGGVEVCEDGVDQDCSGLDRRCGGLYGEVDPDAAFSTVIYSSEYSGVLGSAYAVLDWNGDGQQDLALAATQSDFFAPNAGWVGIYLGPLDAGAFRELDGYEASLYSLNDNARAGAALYPVNDLDGDGRDELYVFSSTSSGTGRAHQGIVLGGTFSGDRLVTDALMANLECYGSRGGGDPDDDGVNGWVCADGDRTLSWFEGTDTTPSMEITDTSNTGFGSSSVVDQDLDGDGVPDLWVAASGANAGGDDRGVVSLFIGPFRTLSTSDADFTVQGDVNYQSVGNSVAVADINGDGTRDVLAGSVYDDHLATDGGAHWGWLGPLSASGSVATADLVVHGEDAGVQLGGQAPAVYDLDGDGNDDLAFSSGSAPGGGEDRGEAWLFYGPFGGTVVLSDAATVGAHLQGDADVDRLGGKVELGSDLNGDGFPELLIGAHGQGWAGSDSAGIFYVLDAR
jgi:hypothetical protein